MCPAAIWGLGSYARGMNQARLSFPLGNYYNDVENTGSLHRWWNRLRVRVWGLGWSATLLASTTWSLVFRSGSWSDLDAPGPVYTTPRVWALGPKV